MRWHRQGNLIDRVPSNLGELLIRPARTDEAERFLAILEDCEQWMHARGNSQWPPGLHRLYADDFAKSIAACEVFFAEHNGEIVATSVLKQKPAFFWEDQPPLSAIYISKLTSVRGFSGRGLGATMLAWCEQHAARIGCAVVRLDCWAKNPTLRAFYARAGYTDLGRAIGYGDYEMALFEKPVESMGSSTPPSRAVADLTIS